MKFPLPRWTTLDWETFAIHPRPNYPPKPVGLAIKRPGERKGRYMAFGHPVENNCTETEAYAVIRDLFKSGEPLLFQEAKFDVEVAMKHVPNIVMPRWDLIHDSKYMIFQHNPHAPSLSLKPSAERILGMPPEEQDELKEWILANVKGAKASDWGAYIALAPAKLVGKYAIGDVVRTDALGAHLLPYLHENGMMDAYNRERKLMPILMRNEQLGIRTDVERLQRDVPVMHADIERCDQYLRKRLKVKDLNVDSDADFGEALARSGVVPDDAFVLTKTGKRSTSKKNLLPEMFRDKKVFQAYSHRNKLSTCVGTFAEPWLAQALVTGGTIHTNHRQVKGEGGSSGDGGARSGRKQTTPNFQNIPKNFNKKDPNYSKPVHLDVLDLPLMRQYLIPDAKDHVWGRRDYNQQELRILAHFEGGSLLNSYLTDPRYDMHKLVQDGLFDLLATMFERDAVKADNFQDIYGGGLEAVCRTYGCDLAMAKRIKEAKRVLMPDVAALRDAIKKHSQDGYPIVTWGGRQYYVEDAKFVDKFNRHMTFEYKLLNYLIQGSAADCTKEALIRYDEHPKRRGRMLIDVHDEINIDAHKKLFKAEMAVLREVMQSLEFDVPMLSDGEFGPNWGSMAKFEEPAFNLKKWKEEYAKRAA